MMNPTNRLSSIEIRQRKTRARDILFAALVAFGTVISIASVSTACDAAKPSIHVAHR